MAVFKAPSRFKSYAAKLWGNDVNCMLDTRDVTHRIFRGDIRDCAIVILGPAGETLWRGSDLTKANYFYRDPGQPPVPYKDLLDNLKPHLGKGLLGGLKVPFAFAQVVALIKSGSLGTAQAALKRMPGGEFKKTLEERLEGLRKTKRELFDGLVAGGDSWGAFKVGSSYVRCFPAAPDASQVTSALRSMNVRPPVKENLLVKQNFMKVAALAFGSRGGSSMLQQARAALAQLAVRYEELEYGRHAATLLK